MQELHPATCPAWQATIPGDLLELIDAALLHCAGDAGDADDRERLHQAARTDPDGLRTAMASWATSDEW